MATRKKPADDGVPVGLRDAGRTLWLRLHEQYDFTTAPERLTLLEQACRTADVVGRLQDTVDQAAEWRTRGSQGQVVSIPELNELRQHRAQLATLIRALGLPDEEETTSGGYLTRSELGKRGAAARWGKRG